MAFIFFIFLNMNNVLIKRYFIVFILFIYYYLPSQNTHHWETAVYSYDIWRYFVPTSSVDPQWNTLSFNDNSWLTGKGGFGYGDNDDSTVVPPCWSVYTRITFTITDKNKISELMLSVDYDDAFVAYLNGFEIARSNIQGAPPNYYTPASSLHEALMYQGGNPESFYYFGSNLQNILQNGTNVLAVSYHNESGSSSDLSGITFLHFGISDASVLFKPNPAWFTPPPSFKTFNLPIVKIFTYGQSIPHSSSGFDIMADMKITNNSNGINHYNDPPNDYNGKILMHVRGSSSAGFPKVSYKIETVDILSNNKDTSVLGFPPENDWILYAPYSEKSLLQNVLAYRISNELGQYASRTKFVHLFIDSNYRGVYVWMEKIKRDPNRVKISKLTSNDLSGDNLTGGYIVKIDKFTGISQVAWTSNFTSLYNNFPIYFQFHDPNFQELHPLQKNYIHAYIDSFEIALSGPQFTHPSNGWRKYADEASFIDHLIINEVCRNQDGYRLSTFMYKDRNSKGGKLKIGPVWDYNLSFGNANYCDGEKFTGWSFKFSQVCPNDIYAVPFWWERLLQDQNFTANLKCRWIQLRNTVLSNQHVLNMIDSCVNVLGPSIQQNFYRWPILNVFVWPNAYIGGSYANEIQYLKNWALARLGWIDAHLPGACILTSSTSDSKSENVSLFPNPCKDFLSVEVPDNEKYEIYISDVLGRKTPVMQLTENAGYLFDVSGLSKGLYIVNLLKIPNGEVLTKKFMKE